MNHEKRIKSLQRKIKKEGLDGMLITERKNIYYLTGFTGDAGLLFVSPNSALLVTDYRFEGGVVEKIQGARYLLTREGYLKGLKNDPIFRKKKVIGFESFGVRYGTYRNIRKILKVKLKPMKDVVERLREIKDEDEIKLMKKAASIGDKALEKVLEIIKPGIRELDIALELEYQMRKLGGEGVSFTTIVASGKRSAIPHGTASNKTIKKGELITIDFGTYYKGYASDMTRTFALGKPSNFLREIYDVVYHAQKIAREQVKTGMKMKEIDALARKYIEERGFGDRFTHSLGHGVGLDVHEYPGVNQKSREVLKEGMVFTIEPGVYVPDKGGVRIEDMVVFMNGKKHVLTRFPRELIIL